MVCLAVAGLGAVALNPLLLADCSPAAAFTGLTTTLVNRRCLFNSFSAATTEHDEGELEENEQATGWQAYMPTAIEVIEV